MSFEAINAMKELLNDSGASLPLLSYQGDGRQFFLATVEASLPRRQVECH